MYGASTGIGRVLKPIKDFETLFQGQRAIENANGASQRIPLFEWIDRQPPNPLDPLAGQDGFDPHLLRYVTVPKGATLRFFLPWLGTGSTDFGPPLFYRYTFAFRDVSLAYSNALQKLGQQTPYHIPYEAPGQPDTTAPPGSQERFILLSGSHSIVVHEPEPPAWVSNGLSLQANPLGFANTSSLRTEAIVPRPEPLPPVLISAGVSGVHQQGILDPNVVNPTDALGANGQWFELVAQGDQMMILIDRETTGVEDAATELWNFGTTDELFSDFYGSSTFTAAPHAPVPELGVYFYVTKGA